MVYGTIGFKEGLEDTALHLSTKLKLCRDKTGRVLNPVRQDSNPHYVVKVKTQALHSHRESLVRQPLRLCRPTVLMKLLSLLMRLPSPVHSPVQWCTAR